ncbi:hypothetical protein BDN70DRAFT_827936 [Pholiota conissans]|uniref:Fork-head domain-containing protein n=1 Tax=Pholiota conissans TaxID=109636 RepID=A0A9P5ZAD1_9AGAR|nr:hypothetical protein BDN70DRAFT_827936 [Pholiota conissans]
MTDLLTSPLPSSFFGSNSLSTGLQYAGPVHAGYRCVTHHANRLAGQPSSESSTQGSGVWRNPKSKRSVASKAFPPPTQMNLRRPLKHYLPTLDLKHDQNINNNDLVWSQNVSPEGPKSDTDFPPPEYTEGILRQSFSIPDGTPVDLRALPDVSEENGKLPGISSLIKLAIWSSPNRRLTLRQIYNAVKARYPHLQSNADDAWQRSIRHNLSLKAMFIRMDRPKDEPGNGSYWTLDLRMGDGNKRKKKQTGKTKGREEDGMKEFSSECQSGPPPSVDLSRTGSYTYADLAYGYSPQSSSYGHTPYIPQLPQGLVCEPHTHSPLRDMNTTPRAGLTLPPLVDTGYPQHISPWESPIPLSHSSSSDSLTTPSDERHLYQFDIPEDKPMPMQNIPQPSIRRHFYISPESPSDWEGDSYASWVPHPHSGLRS